MSGEEEKTKEQEEEKEVEEEEEEEAMMDQTTWSREIAYSVVSHSSGISILLDLPNLGLKLIVYSL